MARLTNEEIRIKLKTALGHAHTVKDGFSS